MVGPPIRAAVLALAAIGAAAPAPAAAATLRVDRGCYTRNQPVRVSGGGYQPGSVQTLFADGRSLGTLTPDANGEIAGRFPAPAPARRRTAVRTYPLIASSSSSGSPVTARTTFQVVHTDVEVDPPFITPGRVVYTALGFTYGPSLYVHYVRTNDGSLVATRRVGRLSGACGRLRRKVLMFLLRPVKAGLYTLVFDNSRRYSPTYRPNFSFQAAVPYDFT